MVISGYFIDGYWWLFYYKLFCIFQVILLQAIGNYFITGYF